MNENKLETISNLFQGNEIRSVWDSEKGDYYFSVIDVIKVLTDSERPRKYWNDLKIKLNKEGSQLSENIGQLKLKASDNKFYSTDVLDTKGILRLIESVPSHNAEPFKLWLASLGSERIDEVFDPEIAIKRAINYYYNKGYDDKWIEARIKAIINRNKLTDIWKKNGVEKDYEFGILTNEIYKEWSGMKASEYKNFKGIRKESLRDNMTDLEILLTDIGETATRELAKEYHPYGLKENKDIAKRGGNIAKNTRDNLEKELGRNIITSSNNLNGKYIENRKEIKE
ncbi:MAG: hypothetical protein NC483_03370 [Ruminococcus sp.]|nr:hypothetical protein [Ruminococcus sp.]